MSLVVLGNAIQQAKLGVGDVVVGFLEACHLLGLTSSSIVGSNLKGNFGNMSLSNF